MNSTIQPSATADLEADQGRFRYTFLPRARSPARKKGEFPKRLRLSPQKVAWLESEVAVWVRDRAEERAPVIDPDDEG